MSALPFLQRCCTVKVCFVLIIRPQARPRWRLPLPNQPRGIVPHTLRFVVILSHIGCAAAFEHQAVAGAADGVCGAGGGGDWRFGSNRGDRCHWRDRSYRSDWCDWGSRCRRTGTGIAFHRHGVNHFGAIRRGEGELNGLAVVACHRGVWADAGTVGLHAGDEAGDGGAGLFSR